MEAHNWTRKRMQKHRTIFEMDKTSAIIERSMQDKASAFVVKNAFFPYSSFFQINNFIKFREVISVSSLKARKLGPVFMH